MPCLIKLRKSKGRLEVSLSEEGVNYIWFSGCTSIAIFVVGVCSLPFFFHAEYPLCFFKLTYIL